MDNGSRSGSSSSVTKTNGVRTQNEKLEVEITFEVRTYDIDIAGHMNNIAYVRWLEDLRSSLFETRCSIGELLGRNLYPVVVSTQITYKRQLKLTDIVRGVMWVESIRHGIMLVKAEFRKGDTFVAAAEQNCILIDLHSGKMDKKAMDNYL